MKTVSIIIMGNWLVSASQSQARKYKHQSANQMKRIYVNWAYWPSCNKSSLHSLPHKASFACLLAVTGYIIKLLLLAFLKVFTYIQYTVQTHGSQKSSHIMTVGPWLQHQYNTSTPEDHLVCTIMNFKSMENIQYSMLPKRDSVQNEVMGNE